MAAVPADGFLPDATVNGWVRSGVAARNGSTLSMRAGAELVLVDALRVLGRSDGESDPYGFTGKVLSLRALLDRGAIIHSNGFKLGAATYDVELGFIAQAVSHAA